MRSFPSLISDIASETSRERDSLKGRLFDALNNYTRLTKHHSERKDTRISRGFGGLRTTPFVRYRFVSRFLSSGQAPLVTSPPRRSAENTVFSANNHQERIRYRSPDPFLKSRLDPRRRQQIRPFRQRTNNREFPASTLKSR